jgi:hypothetical protein
MDTTISLRLTKEIADWLEETARLTGLSKAEIVRGELRKARDAQQRPWSHLIGCLKGGPPDLSTREGFGPREGDRGQRPHRRLRKSA